MEIGFVPMMYNSNVEIFIVFQTPDMPGKDVTASVPSTFFLLSTVKLNAGWA